MRAGDGADPGYYSVSPHAGDWVMMNPAFTLHAFFPPTVTVHV